MRTALLRSCGVTVALVVLSASLPSQMASATTIDGQYDQTGPIDAGSVFNLPVLGRGGVPASGVGSVALNVTVTRPSATSFVTVWPTGQPRPNASNLNFVAGQTVPNMVIVPVGAGGQISIFSESGTTDVLVDVLGWFPVGSSFTGLTPARLLDSRVPSGGTVDGAFNGIGPLAGGTVFNLSVSGRGGVPGSGVGSVALNVTVARPSATSFLSVWPAGQPRPNASNLNFVAGQTVPNMVIVPVGAGGQISIFNELGTTDVLVDVLGWFPVGPSFTGLTPARLLDSRVPSGGTVDGASSGGGPLGGGAVFNLSVSGRGGVPGSGAGSVALNVTVARPSEAGFLTVWPKGQPRPNASNLNFTPGQTVPNMVIVPIGADGQISIVNEFGTTDVLVDVLGWFPVGPSFTGLTPARLLDTRSSNCPGTFIAARPGRLVDITPLTGSRIRYPDIALRYDADPEDSSVLVGSGCTAVHIDAGYLDSKLFITTFTRNGIVGVRQIQLPTSLSALLRPTLAGFDRRQEAVFVGGTENDGSFSVFRVPLDGAPVTTLMRMRDFPAVNFNNPSFAVSADEKIVYAVDNFAGILRADNLQAFDLASRTVRPLSISEGGGFLQYAKLRLSPDGDALCAEGQNIVLTATGSSVPVPVLGADCVGFTPDGNALLRIPGIDGGPKRIAEWNYRVPASAATVKYELPSINYTTWPITGAHGAG